MPMESTMSPVERKGRRAPSARRRVKMERAQVTTTTTTTTVRAGTENAEQLATKPPEKTGGVEEGVKLRRKTKEHKQPAPDRGSWMVDSAFVPRRPSKSSHNVLPSFVFGVEKGARRLDNFIKRGFW